jgi:glycosyltransferase involved in cell wall biosynthesis
MFSRMKISVVIITLNEEDRLEAALKSCSGIADEIVVVDSFSIDRTREIARQYHAAVYKNKFVDYGSQKNVALEKASHEWVLNLDADERISEPLKQEILRLKKENKIPAGGYLINRKTRYLGKWIRHSGWYPDRKLRLFKKSLSRWEGRVHERLVHDGKTGRLKGDILHHTYRNLDAHIQRINRYSGMQAQDIVRNKKKLLLLRAILLPPVTFLRFYIWKMGILDGFPGLVIALVSSWGTALKYLKAIEMKKQACE